MKGLFGNMRHYIRKLILTSICLVLLAGLVWIQSGRSHWQENSLHATGAHVNRKVIVLLVDSLLANSLETLVNNNEAPALSFLLKHGHYRRDMISAFPTMSVTIDSSILTGVYSDRHHIPGLVWFHPQEHRMINYGDGLRVVWKQGVFEWLKDSFYLLNNVHLSKQTPTLHEILRTSGFTSGSINGLIYRGPVTHHFGLKGVPSLNVQGPDLLALGSVARVTDASLPTSPLQSVGMNNNYSAQSLVALIRENRLPDVTLAYFPDLDGDLHTYGPTYLRGVKELDSQLQQVLGAFGNWERALDSHVFIVMGDSGVTATSGQKTALIDLEQALSGMQLYRSGNNQAPEDDLAIAINGRMCFVYALSERVSIEPLVNRLKSDTRIDLVAWQDPNWIHVRQGDRELSYRSGRQYRDVFNQSWDIRGDLSVLNLETRGEDKRLISNRYPDGLRRLQSAFQSHSGRFLILTAQPGSEFSGDGAPNHLQGGNHGSLDASDSTFPFLVASSGAVPPPPVRIIDVKDYILSLLR